MKTFGWIDFAFEIDWDVLNLFIVLFVPNSSLILCLLIIDDIQIQTNVKGSEPSQVNQKWWKSVGVEVFYREEIQVPVPADTKQILCRLEISKSRDFENQSIG